MQAVLAILPIFLLILTGYALARAKFLEAAFWVGADRLTYYVLFPALLFVGISKPGESLEGLGLIVLAVGATLFLGSGGLWFLKRALKVEDRDYMAYYQGGIRFNTFIGISMVMALFGDEGMFYASIIISFMVPLINTLCVVVLTLCSSQKEVRGMKILKDIAKNPLIIACLLGLLFRYGELALPDFLLSFLTILGRSALPLGLLSVGTALSIKGLLAPTTPLVAFGGFKLLILPCVAYGVGVGLGFEATLLWIFVLLFALPTASSSYILVRQFGGDTGLMSKIITAETILSTVSLTLLAYLWA